jgi:hypothetical protein
MHMLRKAARKTLETLELHPDTMRNFRDYEGTIYAPNREILLLSCDQWTRGEISASDFRLAVEQARVYADGPRARKPQPFKKARPAPKPIEPKPTVQLVETQLVDRRIAARRNVSTPEPQPERWSADRSKEPSGF